MVYPVVALPFPWFEQSKWYLELLCECRHLHLSFDAFALINLVNDVSLIELIFSHVIPKLSSYGSWRTCVINRVKNLHLSLLVSSVLLALEQHNLTIYDMWSFVWMWVLFHLFNYIGIYYYIILAVGIPKFNSNCTYIS
jgi:hypothetical protein